MPSFPSFFAKWHQSNKSEENTSIAITHLDLPDKNVIHISPVPDDMSNAFVSKARRVRFDLQLRIIDLNNVPLVSGTSFIKWHLPSSTAAEHRGRTNKCAIREHRVEYEYEKKMPVRLTLGKDNMLQECEIQFEILQEYGAGGRGERIRLGEVKLNLAEYVESSDPQSPTSPGGGSVAEGMGEEGIVRRYLMQDSKINSTLKLGIHMRHIEGTREYFSPPLRTAPVFGGIAGIISSSEPAGSTTHGMSNNLNLDPDGTENSNLPNLSTTNKEAGEMQDMYRRTLAAFWASQPGELKADDAVEDIFSGGDGWGKNGRPETMEQRDILNAGTRQDNSQPGSGATTPTRGATGVPSEPGQRPKSSHRAYTGKHRHKKGRTERRGQGEVDEFDIREDLRSWRIGERAYG